MPLPRRSLSLPRTWFLTVRLLELAVVVLLVGVGLELWQAFRASSQAMGQYYGDASVDPGQLTFMQRIMAFAFFGGIFQGPVLLVLAACLLAAAVGVLHVARPVAHARYLRWELLGGWSVAALLVLVRVVTTGVAMFGHDPSRPDDPNVVTYGYQGPSLVEQGVAVLTQPVAAGALLAAAGLWWLRLPAEFEEPEDEPAADEEGVWTGTADGAGAHRSVSTADLDDLVLDGVEQIDPVERLGPTLGSGGDGSTTSGYDDYFRRF